MTSIRSLTLTAAALVIVGYSFIVFSTTKFSETNYGSSSELYNFPDNFDKNAFAANVEAKLAMQRKEHLAKDVRYVERDHFERPLDEEIHREIGLHIGIEHMTNDPVRISHSAVSIKDTNSHENQESVTESEIDSQTEALDVNETEEGTTRLEDSTRDSDEVDLEWLAQRERLLKANGPRKLFLFAYMHGGSTLLFKLFDQDPRTFAWYESLAPLYGHMYGLPAYRTHTWIIKNTSNVHEGHYYPRTVSDYETGQIRQLLKAMFECKFGDMPKEMFTSSFMLYSTAFKNYTRCYTQTKRQPNALWEADCVDHILSPICGQEGTAGPAPSIDNAVRAKCPERLKLAREMLSVQDDPKTEDKEMQAFIDKQKCVNELFSAAQICIKEHGLEDQCKSSILRTTKILRLKMMFMEPMIRAIPDIQVVFYTRDPRATISSRHRNKQNDMKRWITGITKLCSEMAMDVEALEQLERKFPGAFLRLRYEDLVESPDQTVRALFDHVHLDPTERAFDWIHSALHSELNEGQQRTNASFTASKWRQNYPQDSIDDVSNSPECKTLLRQLGYEGNS